MHHAGIQYGQPSAAMSTNHLQQQHYANSGPGISAALNPTPGSSNAGNGPLQSNGTNMPIASVPHNLSHPTISSISANHSEINTTQVSTATLRQWRKKDDKLHSESNSITNNTEGQGPIARVAPHAHYPRTNDFRYQNYAEYTGMQGYKDLSQVKYSEIVEPHPQSNHITPVIQKPLHKEKDYMEMCSIVQQPQVPSQSQVKHYPPNPMLQYINKDYAVHPKESHHHSYHPQLHKDYPYPSQNYKLPNQYQRAAQISSSSSGSVSMTNQYHQNEYLGFAPPPPPANENLQQIYQYSNRTYMHQHRGYRNFAHGSVPSPSGIAPPTPNLQQYNFPTVKNPDLYRGNPYAPKYDYKLGASHQFDMRNISPRRVYHDTYAPRVSPNYPGGHCSSGQMLEYAQHYQNRREYIIPPIGPQELPINKVPNYGQQMPDVVPDVQSINPLQHPQMSTASPSDGAKSSLKQYFENWNDELMEEKQREAAQNVPAENLYILDSAEIPSENVGEFIHLQVDKLPENIKGFLNPTVIASPLNLTQDSVIREPGISVISETKKFIDESKVSPQSTDTETTTAPCASSNSNSSVIIFADHNKSETEENKNTVVTQAVDTSVIKTAGAKIESENSENEKPNPSHPSNDRTSLLDEIDHQPDEYQSPRTPGSTLEEIPKPLNAIDELLDESINENNIDTNSLASPSGNINSSPNILEETKTAETNCDIIDTIPQEPAEIASIVDTIDADKTKESSIDKVDSEKSLAAEEIKDVETENVVDHVKSSVEDKNITVQGDSVTLEILGEKVHISVSHNPSGTRNLLTIVSVTDCDLNISSNKASTSNISTQTEEDNTILPTTIHSDTDNVPLDTEENTFSGKELASKELKCFTQENERNMPVINVDTPPSPTKQSDEFLQQAEDQSSVDIQSLNPDLLSANEIHEILFNENCNEIIIDHDGIMSSPTTPSPILDGNIFSEEDTKHGDNETEEKNDQKTELDAVNKTTIEADQNNDNNIESISFDTETTSSRTSTKLLFDDNGSTSASEDCSSSSDVCKLKKLVVRIKQSDREKVNLHLKLKNNMKQKEHTTKTGIKKPRKRIQSFKQHMISKMSKKNSSTPCMEKQLDSNKALGDEDKSKSSKGIPFKRANSESSSFDQNRKKLRTESLNEDVRSLENNNVEVKKQSTQEREKLKHTEERNTCSKEIKTSPRKTRLSSTESVDSTKQDKNRYSNCTNEAKSEICEKKDDSKTAFTSSKHNFSILSREEKTKTKIKTPSSRNRKLESLVESSIIAHHKTEKTATEKSNKSNAALEEDDGNQNSKHDDVIQKILIPVKTKAQLKETPVVNSGKNDMEPNADDKQIETNLQETDDLKELNIEDEISTTTDIITSLACDKDLQMPVSETKPLPESPKPSAGTSNKSPKLCAISETNRKRLSLAEYKKMRCDRLPSFEEERKKLDEFPKPYQPKEEDFDTLLEKALDAPMHSKLSIPSIIDTINLKPMRPEDELVINSPLPSKPIVIELESEKNTRPSDPRVQKYGMYQSQSYVHRPIYKDTEQSTTIVHDTSRRRSLQYHPNQKPELKKRASVDSPLLSKTKGYSEVKDATNNNYLHYNDPHPPKEDPSISKAPEIRNISQNSYLNDTHLVERKPSSPIMPEKIEDNLIRQRIDKRKMSRSSSSSSSSDSSSDSSDSDTDSSRESSDSEPEREKRKRSNSESVQMDINKEIDDIFTLTKKKFEIRPRKTVDTTDVDRGQANHSQSAHRFLINLDEIRTNLIKRESSPQLCSSRPSVKRKKLLIDPDDFNLDEDYVRTASSSESEKEKDKTERLLEQRAVKNIIDLNELLPNTITSYNNSEKNLNRVKFDDTFYVSHTKRNEEFRRSVDRDRSEHNINQFMNREAPTVDQIPKEDYSETNTNDDKTNTLNEPSVSLNTASLSHECDVDEKCSTESEERLVLPDQLTTLYDSNEAINSTGNEPVWCDGTDDKENITDIPSNTISSNANQLDDAESKTENVEEENHLKYAETEPPDVDVSLSNIGVNSECKINDIQEGRNLEIELNIEASNTKEVAISSLDNSQNGENKNIFSLTDNVEDDNNNTPSGGTYSNDSTETLTSTSSDSEISEDMNSKKLSTEVLSNMETMEIGNEIEIINNDMSETKDTPIESESSSSETVTESHKLDDYNQNKSGESEIATDSVDTTSTSDIVVPLESIKQQSKESDVSNVENNDDITTKNNSELIETEIEKSKSPINLSPTYEAVDIMQPMSPTDEILIPEDLSMQSAIQSVQSKLGEFTHLHDDLSLSDDDDDNDDNNVENNVVEDVELPSDSGLIINLSKHELKQDASESSKNQTELKANCDVVDNSCAATENKEFISSDIPSCSDKISANREMDNSSESTLTENIAPSVPKFHELSDNTNEEVAFDDINHKHSAESCSDSSTNKISVPVNTPVISMDTNHVDGSKQQLCAVDVVEDSNDDVSCTIEETKVIIRNLRKREQLKGTKSIVKDLSQPDKQAPSKSSKVEITDCPIPINSEVDNSSSLNLKRKPSIEEISQRVMMDMTMSNPLGSISNLNPANSFYHTNAFPNFPLSAMNLSAGAHSANPFKLDYQPYHLAWLQLFYQQQYFQQQLKNHVGSHSKEKLDETRQNNDKQYASVLSNEDLKMKLQLIPPQNESLQMPEVNPTEEDKRRRRRRRLKPSTSSTCVEDDDYLVIESSQDGEKLRSGGIPKLIIKRSISNSTDVEAKTDLQPTSNDVAQIVNSPIRKKRKP